MGMYTQLSIGVEFKTDAPEDIIKAVAYMVKHEEGATPDFSTDHPVFQTDRWEWMLRSAGSYYFDAQPLLAWEYDDISKAWFLTVCTDIKNYSGEWEAFLDFIAPHLDSHGYIGTYRYEEDDLPTLLLCQDGKITFNQVTLKDSHDPA